MKLAFLSAVLMTAALGTAHAEADARQYDITGMKVREIPEVRAMDGTVGLGVDCSSLGKGQPHAFADSGSMDPIDNIGMIVDKIINIGRKIWSIVEAGKPVSNMKTDVATAMPLGAKCWTDLQAWSMPESHTYQVAFVNGFGVEVVKLSYRVLWLPGGQANGVGQYIGYATMQPVNIEVAWGFSLNANVSIPTVFNMGTKDAPIGAMQMNMQYRIESPVKTIDQGQAFVIDGRGNFKML